MKQIRRIPIFAEWQDLKHHELSSLVEFGAGIDLEQLAAHMRANGYDEDEPIILLEGQIFDGRHRHKAALLADVRPTFAEFIGPDPLAYVTKKILRQHLNESQRAMLAARLANLPEGRPGKTTAIAVVSQADAAGLLNVSVDSVQRAKTVTERGTAKLQAAVTDGTVSVSDAAKVATEAPKVQNRAVADVQAGRAPTATQAVEKLCDRCRRIGTPVRDCPACARLKAEKPPAPKPTPKPAAKSAEREPGDDTDSERAAVLESAKAALLAPGPTWTLTREQRDLVLTELEWWPVGQRPRNPHFDALAEATGSDAKVKSQASMIGKFQSELRKAGYTPREILEAGRLYEEQMGAKPSPSALAKWITRLLAGERIIGSDQQRKKRDKDSEVMNGYRAFVEDQ